jgi:hypothetical protein
MEPLKCNCGFVAKTARGFTKHKNACKLTKVVDAPIVTVSDRSITEVTPNEIKYTDLKSPNTKVLKMSSKPPMSATILNGEYVNVVYSPTANSEDFAKMAQNFCEVFRNGGLILVNEELLDALGGTIPQLEQLHEQMAAASVNKVVAEPTENTRTCDLEVICSKQVKIIEVLKNYIAHLENKILCPNDPPLIIKINVFTRPNIGYISDTIFAKILKTEKTNTPFELILLIWLNPDHPENFSIYTPDSDRRDVMVYNGNSWITQCYIDVFNIIRELAYTLTLHLIEQTQKYELYSNSVIEELKNNKDDPNLTILDYKQLQKLFAKNCTLISLYNIPHIPNIPGVTNLL